MNPKKHLYGIVSLMGTFFFILFFIFNMGIKINAESLNVEGFSLSYKVKYLDSFLQEKEKTINYEIDTWNNNANVTFSYDNTIGGATNYSYYICTVTETDECNTTPEDARFSNSNKTQTFYDGQYVLWIKTISTSEVKSYKIKIDTSAPTGKITNLEKNNNQWKQTFYISYSYFSSIVDTGSGISKITYTTCDIDNEDDCTTGASITEEMTEETGYLTINDSKTYVFKIYDSVPSDETLSTTPNILSQTYKFHIDNGNPTMKVNTNLSYCDDVKTCDFKWFIKGSTETTKFTLTEFNDNDESGVKEYGYIIDKMEDDNTDYKDYTFSPQRKNGTDTNITSMIYNYDYSALGEGYYRVTFYVLDQAGNKSNYTYWFGITSKPSFKLDVDEGHKILNSVKCYKDTDEKECVESNKIILNINTSDTTYYNVGKAGFSHYEYSYQTAKNNEYSWNEWSAFTKYEDEITWTESGFYNFKFKVCDKGNNCSDELSYSLYVEKYGKNYFYLDKVSDTLDVVIGKVVAKDNNQYLLVNIIVSNVISEKEVLKYTFGSNKEYSDGEEWHDLSMDDYNLNEIYKPSKNINNIIVYYRDKAGNEIYVGKETNSENLKGKFNYIAPTLSFGEENVITLNGKKASFTVEQEPTSTFTISQICYSWTKEKTTLTTFTNCSDFKVEYGTGDNYGLLSNNEYKEYELSTDLDFYQYLKDNGSGEWYLNIGVMDNTGEVAIKSQLYIVDFDAPIIELEADKENVEDNNTWLKDDLNLTVKFSDTQKISKITFNMHVIENNIPNPMLDGADVMYVKWNYTYPQSTYNDSIKEYLEKIGKIISNDTDTEATINLKILISNTDYFNSSNSDGGKFKLEIKGYDIYGNECTKDLYFQVDRVSDDFEIEWSSSSSSTQKREFGFKTSNSRSPIKKYCYVNGHYELSELFSDEIKGRTCTDNKNGFIKESGEWTFYIQDGAGNETIKYEVITDIDTEAPYYLYAGSTWNYHNTWSKEAITINIKIKDDASDLSRVGYTFLAKSELPDPQNLNTVSMIMKTITAGQNEIGLGYTLNQTGIYYLIVYAQDVFGNEAYYVVGAPDVNKEYKEYNDENKEYIKENYQIKVDLVAPDMTDSVEVYYNEEDNDTAKIRNGWYNKNLHIKFVPNDEGSGNVRIKYRLMAESSPDITSAQILLNDLSGTTIKENTFFEIEESGRYKLFYVATDEAGNVSSLYRKTILLDKEAPVAIGGSAVSSNFLNEIEVISKTENSICGYTNIIDLSMINSIKDTYTTNANDLEKVLVGVSVNKIGNIKYLEKSEMENLLCKDLGDKDTESYYLHIKVIDLAGNIYEEFYQFYLKRSVPPQISFNVETISTLIEDGKVKLYCINDSNIEEVCDLDNMVMPRRIDIAIGTDFVPFLEAIVKYKNGTINRITNNDFYIDLDFDKEGSKAYVCFEATDPSSASLNKTGDIRLCNDTNAYIKELQAKYDKSVDAYLGSTEYKSALNNRIELRIAYLDGPYLSFDKDSIMDNKEGVVDTTKLVDYQTSYISTIGSIIKYTESGVYYRDVNGIHELFESDLGEGKLIGFQIKKWNNTAGANVCPVSVNELNADTLNTYWTTSCFLDGTYSFSQIGGNEGSNFFIKYFEQNRAVGIQSQNIYRRVQIIDVVPEIIKIRITNNTINADAVNMKNDDYQLFLDEYFMCNIDQCELDISIYKYDSNKNKEVSVEKQFLEENNTKRQFLDKREIGTYYLYVRCIKTTQTNSFSSSVLKITVDIQDKKGPNIRLVDSKVIIDYKGIYIEKWPTADDEIDGEITEISKNITYIDKEENQKSGIAMVDTSTLGTYVITYSASDKSGNTSVAERRVYVVDITRPIINFTDDKTNVYDGTSEYSYTIERGEKIPLENFYLQFVKSVSDNYNKDLTINDVEVIGEIDTSKADEYILTYRLSDNASSYNVTNVENVGDNRIEIKIKIIVKDTTKPIVSIYDINPALDKDERKIPLEENKVFENLYTGVYLDIDTDKEYGDKIKIYLNGLEQTFKDIELSTKKGYYDFKIVDSSGNYTHICFGINNSHKVSLFGKNLEEIEISINTENAKYSYIDPVTKKALVKIDKGEYQPGDTIVISYYDSSNKYYVHSYLELTEREIQILSIDDYTLIIDLDTNKADYLFSFIIDKETSQKLNFIETETVPTENNTKMILTLISGGVVAIGLILILVRMKKKKK